MKTNKYTEHLQLTGKSQASINAVTGAEKIFKLWTGKSAIRATGAAVKKFVRRAQQEAQTQAQKRTVIQRYNTLKQIAIFYNNFSMQKMLNTIDIKRALKAESKSRLTEDWTAKAFTADEQAAIIDVINRQKKPIWFKPIMLLYSATGARLSELTNLKFVDVSEDRKSIIVTGKGRKRRRVEIISTQASRELTIHINRRLNDNYRQPGPEDFIFKTQKIASPHVTPRAVEQQFDRILNQLGIKRPGRSIHCFRHTFITAAIEGQAPVHIVAAQVGHANINTTIQHYTHTKQATIRGELRQALLFKKEQADPEGKISHSDRIISIAQ